MKMKKYVIFAAFLGLTGSISAQNWVKEAKKAVLSIVTYDKDGNLLNKGNGFYISTDGTALSDYNLFKGAHRAEVFDADGQKSEVAFILGANDMYDVVKFKVNAAKKVTALTLATSSTEAGKTVYLLPYSTQKNAVAQKTAVSTLSDVAGSYKFYTLGTGIEDKNASCPVFNEGGQVIGVAQKGTATESYAMDSQYAGSLTVGALSANDYVLNSIDIAKDLPEKAEDAVVYVMMKGNEPAAVERLIEKFPDQEEGYLKRATNLANQKSYAAADADIKTYLEKAVDKAEAHYQYSKLMYNVSVYLAEENHEPWNLDKALNEIEQSTALSNEAMYRKHKADVLYAQGKYEEAYQTYNALIGSDLKNEELYTFMADCKDQLKASHEEILALLDSAVAQFTKPYPNEAAPYLYARAIRKASAGKYREAVNDYNDVEHIYGGRANAEFYYNRELAEKNCRMYQQAMDDINEALELAPTDLEIMLEHASLHISLKNYDLSKATAEKVIALHPEEALGYRFLGFCQAMQGDKAAAKTNLLKAKELGDQNADTIIDKYCK